jgi:hypothetical protein
MNKFNQQNFIFVLAILIAVFFGGVKNNFQETTPSFQSSAIETITISKISLKADLNQMILYFYENDLLKKEYKILSKGDPSKWWQTPTGNFKIEMKSENFWSDFYLVNLPWASQFYGDFFINGIPKDKNGNNLTQAFTAGSLVLSDSDAKELYQNIKIKTPIFIYKNDLTNVENELERQSEFIPENLKSIFENNRFSLPVNPELVFIKKDFGSPTILDNQKGESSVYVNHTGVDFEPKLATKKAYEVRAIFDGKVVLIKENEDDFGKTIVLEHNLEYGKVYSLYGRLKSFGGKIGDVVLKNQIVGEIDDHLHFEIKKSAVDDYYGYTPNEPMRFGYFDPIQFILDNQ